MIKTKMVTCNPDEMVVVGACLPMSAVKGLRKRIFFPPDIPHLEVSTYAQPTRGEVKDVHARFKSGINLRVWRAVKLTDDLTYYFQRPSCRGRIVNEKTGKVSSRIFAASTFIKSPEWLGGVQKRSEEGGVKWSHPLGDLMGV